ncbi:hypothetical protein [Klenkia sp. PcliD-1-E]|uniref:hypothetical protein n=1 Tax=Klenkia sp. PcliD-1-E TaxID=2954492 RepID=UPI00209726B7|nr:hypothetical protein [Klenkia sp. PcliD-1-E]MCO7220932.1 hypothetical protein [Klenkia sp. PcliD-1-E]
MDPFLARALLEHHGVFAAAHARSAGFDRHAIAAQVRTGAWHQVRYGVYTTRSSWEQHAADDELHRLAAAAVLLRLRRDGTVLSHGTAARLHGLVLPAGAGTDVELTDPDQFRSGRGYHVRRASLPADDVTEVDGLPVTSLARTLADVGREWDVVDTVVAADDLLADGRLTGADLRATALRHAHWPGAGRMAHALGLARVGAHSPHETRTRLQIAAAGLPEPTLQAAVHRLDGRMIGVLDMLWLPHGVFGECDGRVKTTDPWNGRTPAEAVWREKCRHDDLVDVDLRGIRFKPADLYAVWPQKLARLHHLLEGPVPERLMFRAEQWNGGLRSRPRHVRPAA